MKDDMTLSANETVIDKCEPVAENSSDLKTRSKSNAKFEKIVNIANDIKLNETLSRLCHCLAHGADDNLSEMLTIVVQKQFKDNSFSSLRNVRY